MSDEACLEVRNVTVRFGILEALADVSVRFDAHIVGVIGLNGAGKSTLANVLMGQVGVAEGDVVLGDDDLLRHSTRDRISLGISRAAQHPVVMPSLTVFENLALTKLVDRDHLEGVIDSVGLRPWMDQDVNALPYGVRKLAEFARAFAVKPKIMICDEPLSGLDETSREQMVGVLLRAAATGTRLIVIEHDVNRVAQIADKLICLDHGKKIAEGKPQDVLNAPIVRRAFFGEVDEEAASEAAAIL